MVPGFTVIDVSRTLFKSAFNQMRYEKIYNSIYNGGYTRISRKMINCYFNRPIKILILIQTALFICNL